VRNILHRKRASPEFGIWARYGRRDDDRGQHQSCEPIRKAPRNISRESMKRKAGALHDSCEPDDHDDSWPARKTEVFGIWDLSPTSRRSRPIVSADHAPGLVTSTSITRRVCPHRDAWIHTARGRQGFRNEQGRSKEALAAGTARSTRRVNPVLAAFLFSGFPRHPCTSGGGQGTYGTPGSRRGLGVLRENRLDFRCIRFWTCVTK